MERIKVVAYTDGACSGNPGPGGWAVVLISGSARKSLSGNAPQTTNNRMELTAVLEAVKALKTPCELEVHTDSNYVMMSRTKWKRWQRKVDFPNRDLWLELVDAGNRGHHHITFVKVAGHSGDPINEECDKAAKAAIKR